MTDRWDDRELERLMKEGLEARASEADVDVPVAERARAAARGGRWRTAAAAGLVAASVAGVAGGVALVRDDEPRSGGVLGDNTPTVVEEWRTEYWHDIQVDVPADWGWGGSPRLESQEPELGGDMLIACAAGAFKAPGLRDREIDWETTPYVGRPLGLTDVCEIFRDGQWREPEAPYLWLGTPIEPGIREFGNGYVQETIEFEGEPVTVATNDPSLREQILDSVTGGETCMSEYEGRPPTSQPTEGYGELTGLTVCAYSRSGPGELARLTYAVELGASAAAQLLDVVSSQPVVDLDCQPAVDDAEWVQLNLRGHDPKVGQTSGAFVVDLDSCASIDTGAGTVLLNEANVAPWAVGGLPAVLHASWAYDEPWMSDYFIGPQG